MQSSGIGVRSAWRPLELLGNIDEYPMARICMTRWWWTTSTSERRRQPVPTWWLKTDGLAWWWLRPWRERGWQTRQCRRPWPSSLSFWATRSWWWRAMVKGRWLLSKLQLLRMPSVWWEPSMRNRQWVTRRQMEKRNKQWRRSSGEWGRLPWLWRRSSRWRSPKIHLPCGSQDMLQSSRTGSRLVMTAVLRRRDGLGRSGFVLCPTLGRRSWSSRWARGAEETCRRWERQGSLGATTGLGVFLGWPRMAS